MSAGGLAGSPDVEPTNHHYIPALEARPPSQQDPSFDEFCKMFWEIIESAAFRWPKAHSSGLYDTDFA